MVSHKKLDFGDKKYLKILKLISSGKPAWEKRGKERDRKVFPTEITMSKNIFHDT